MMTKQVAGLNVSRETYERLRAYSALTAKWTRKINLIAASTADGIWDRHIVDSAQLYHFAPQQFGSWVDLGSGGGFPGVVMAALAKEKMPKAQFTFIESDQRKATFLRTANRELGLSATVIAARIEEAPQQSADVVSARALAPLHALLGLVSAHIAQGGIALLPKGKQALQEIADAQKTWRFELEDHASFTDPDARILAIQRITSLGQ